MYREDVYGDMFHFDIDKIPFRGVIDTVDGEVEWEKKVGKLVYLSNGSELSTHDLFEIEIKYAPREEKQMNLPFEKQSLINEVYKKVGELQHILAQKLGKNKEGGENKNKENFQGGFTTNINNDKLNIYKADNNLNNNSGQGGLQNMKPITRDGEPVQDGKLVDPKVIASMAQGGDMPPTDLLNLAKLADPYNESNVPAFNRVGSGIDTLEQEQKKTQSVEEHKKIEPVVEKKVSASEIQDVIDKVKELKRANKEIDEITEDDIKK